MLLGGPAIKISFIILYILSFNLVAIAEAFAEKKFVKLAAIAKERLRYRKALSWNAKR